MSDTATLKDTVMKMAVEDAERLFFIIGDLGYTGYRVSLCKINGYSLQQCGLKYGITKQAAHRAWEKCKANKYDRDLRKFFGITKQGAVKA